MTVIHWPGKIRDDLDDEDNDYNDDDDDGIKHDTVMNGMVIEIIAWIQLWRVWPWLWPRPRLTQAWAQH